MKFDEAVKSQFSRTLKRIRIKIDPLHASSENFIAADSYEGFILEETDESLRVMIIKPGMPVMDIPKEVLAEPSMFDMFKLYVEERLGVHADDPTCPLKPFTAKTFEELEVCLSRDGFTNKEIANFYKNFLKYYDECR